MTDFSRLCFYTVKRRGYKFSRAVPLSGERGGGERRTLLIPILYKKKRRLFNETTLSISDCRLAYEAGFSPICPLIYLPLFLDDGVPEEHKAGIDMARDMLRRSHTLIVCGETVDEDVKNDIAVAGRLGIAATTLEGVLAVKGHGRNA